MPSDFLIERTARAICSATNIARPGQIEVIYDDPDDLTWDSSASPPAPMRRWTLYEDQARAVLDAVHMDELVQALNSIIVQVKRGQNAIPIITDRSWHDIDALARRALDRLE